MPQNLRNEKLNGMMFDEEGMCPMVRQAIQVNSKVKTYFLFPGDIFISREEYWVTTILGSCISVCLWDPVNKIGGINHFLLPRWNGVGLASPKFGDIAIKKLIEKMSRHGSHIKNLQAKIFGGAIVLQTIKTTDNVGAKNIALAKTFLRKEQIPIVASDVGGTLGRRIKFNTNSGIVIVKKILSAKK